MWMYNNYGMSSTIGQIFSRFSLSTLVSILLIVEYWFVFQKAGEEGWKSLIPFYGDYIGYKIAKKEKLYWWKLGVSIATGIIMYMFIACSIFFIMPLSLDAVDHSGSIAYLMLMSMLLIASGVALIVFEVKRCLGIAKVFGQSTAFAIGLILLKPVFFGILAFSKDIEYKGNIVESNKEVPNPEKVETVDNSETVESVDTVEDAVNTEENTKNVDSEV